jgi:4'-phosphopantetheinyl transferase
MPWGLTVMVDATEGAVRATFDPRRHDAGGVAGVLEDLVAVAERVTAARVARGGPGLASDAVDVWVASLDAPSRTVTALRADLTAEERGRADAFRAARDRRRAVVARGLLRQLLAGYLDVRPAALALGADARGKPRLAGPHAGTPLRFSLSHAGDAALYAVAWGREVGVDLERADPAVDWAEVAATVFSPAERRRLGALPADAARAAFFRQWTRREAWLKATGEGLAGLARPAPDWGALPPEAGGWALADGEARWRLVDLEVLPGHAAALVVEGDAPVAPIVRGRREPS